MTILELLGFVLIVAVFAAFLYGLWSGAKDDGWGD